MGFLFRCAQFDLISRAGWVQPCPLRLDELAFERNSLTRFAGVLDAVLAFAIEPSPDRAALQTLASRFRADIVTYFPELFWSFEQTPFPLLSLLIGCRCITESVDLVAGQVVGL